VASSSSVTKSSATSSSRSARVLEGSKSTAEVKDQKSNSESGFVEEKKKCHSSQRFTDPAKKENAWAKRSPLGGKALKKGKKEK
jgi:hypothetical protein